MADKGKDDKKDSENDGKKGKGAKGGESSAKKVELVDQGNASAGLPGYIGVGLLGGVVLGFGPLRDAAQGNGPFEDAMVRFLACLLVCVVAASVIGRMLDNAPTKEGANDGEIRARDGGEDGASEAATGDESAERATDPTST